jgi:hypothetical protein
MNEFNSGTEVANVRSWPIITNFSGKEAASSDSWVEVEIPA